MKRAKAFVFAAEEDFGIIPVEVQACGTPVIAFGKGGALETVVGYQVNPDKATGVFFGEQEPQSIVDAVGYFEEVQDNITAQNCLANAHNFTSDKFRHNLQAIVDEELRRKYD